VLGQDELDVERSFANLPQVQTTTFGELSAHDVIRADWLVFSDRTLPSSPSQFSGTHVVEEEPAHTEPDPAPAQVDPAPAKAAKTAKATKKTAPKIKTFAEVEGKPEAATAESGEEADTDA
jgi:hypothetical protein